MPPALIIQRPTIFDEALPAPPALVGERVEVHVMDAGETRTWWPTFGGGLWAGYSMAGGEPSDNEAIFFRLEAGKETGDQPRPRGVRGGIAHEDGAITSSSAAWRL